VTTILIVDERVGAWPENFIFDTQLGPNRDGRRW